MNIIKPVTFRVFHKGEWAYGAAFPDVGSGFAITMTTSFGNFGYIWSHPGDDHLGFLKSLDMDYAMGKMVEDHETHEFDHEATHKAAKIAVKDMFEHEDDERRKKAEEAVKECFEGDHFRDENHYADCAMSDLSPFPFMYYEDIPIEKVFKPQLQAFWEKLWPQVLAEIEKGLA